MHKLSFIFAALMLPAVALASPSQATPDKVLAFIHAQDYLADAYGFLEEAMARRAKEVSVPKEQRSNILKLAKRIYPASNLYEVFKEAYARNIKPEFLADFYNWTNTPSGIHLRKAYDEAYRATAAERQAHYDRHHKGQNRRNVIESYIRITEQPAAYGLWQAMADFGVLRALNAYATAKDSVKFLRAKVNQRRASYAAAGTTHYLAFNFYLFKDMKNDQVDACTKFAASPAGQAHTKAFLAALEGTLVSAAATLEAQIAKP